MSTESMRTDNMQEFEPISIITSSLWRLVYCYNNVHVYIVFYPLSLVTRIYNGSEFQPSQMTGRQRHSVDVRQVSTMHVKMLYVEHETCRGLSRSVVYMFEFVKFNVEHVEVVEEVEVVEVLDFVEIWQYVDCRLDHSSFLKKQWYPLCIRSGEETCWLLQ